MALGRKRVARLLEYLLTIWVILTINFILPRAMPGDPFLHQSAAAGEEITVLTEEQRQYYLEYYGLDRPLLRQKECHGHVKEHPCTSQKEKNSMIRKGAV